MLLALFAGVFRYVDQHFHTPETFLENTSELAANADVRERLQEGLIDEIIAIAEGDITEEVDSGTDSQPQDNLPEPVTEEQIARDQAIEDIILDISETAEFEQQFQAALQRTQVELIASADLEPLELLRNDGEVFFNMRALYPLIYDQLRANPLTTEITQTLPPEGYGIFKVADRETTMNVLWTLLRKGPNWRGLVTFGAIVSFAGAVVVAERRPSTAIQFGGGMVGVGIVSIVIIYLIRFIVPVLAGGGSSGNAVVAVYAANLAPLVGVMIRLVVFGAVIAAIGGIAKLIWPDDWVYSNVSDERGIRSIRRRRGAPEAEQPAPAQQPQQLQPAAMAPGYGGYPQPYPGYPPQQWGQPYPGQYPPGYPQPYPAGPYAQPAQPLPQQLPQHYTSPGKPTVPVMPVQVEQGPAGELIPPAAPPLDAMPGDLPADAAQIVPRVVATTDTTLDVTSSETPPAAATPPARETVAEPAATPDVEPTPVRSSGVTGIPKIVMPGEDLATDESWSGEKDW